MARALTAGMQAQVTADRLSPILLMKFEFDSETLRFWTGSGTLDHDGQSWTGSGTLLQVSAIEETAAMVAAGLTFTLSGMPDSIVATALNEDYPGRPVTLWLGAITETAGRVSVVADPVQIFAGLADVMPIEDGGTEATVQLTAESRLVDLERPRKLLYTPEMQKNFYPADLGFDEVAGLQDAEIVWGRG